MNRVALLLLLVLGPRAVSGQWTRVTELTGRNIDQVSRARTPDGTLHLAWLRANGTRWDVVHGAIDSTGTALGIVTPIVTGWASLNVPFLLATPQGTLRVFLSGVRGSTAGDPYEGAIYTATAPATGDSWELAPGGITQSRSTDVPAATFGADGTPVVAWAAGMSLGTHVGLRDRDPDQDHGGPCCPYHPALATDATGDVILAWYSNADGAHGITTKTLEGGDPIYVPGSAAPDRNASIPPVQRTALLARAGGGVYVAYCSGYPTCQRVNLWRHGGGPPITVATVRNARLVNGGAGPEGRLWVMWTANNRLYATRSNRAATRVGAIVSTPPPPGTQTIWQVTGDGALGALDLLAAVTTPAGLATWHTRLLPGLSLSAEPRSFSAGDSAKVVTFRVTDAGDAVAGATVTAAGQTGISDAAGRVSLSFPAATRPGSIAARATATGYVPASATVTVEAPPPKP